MPRFKDEQSRRQYFIDRYGEEDGQRRYEEKLAKETDAPMDAAQGSPDAATRERVPRRRSRKPNPTEVYTAVGSALYLTDATLVWAAPNAWTQEDRLSPDEIGRLSIALGDEILASDKLTQWMVRAQRNSVHVKLAYTLTLIAAPRLARRNMLPQGIFGETTETSVPMESGATSEPNWDDGEWQKYPGSTLTGQQEIRSSPAEQSGRGEIHVDGDDTVRFADGRPSGLPASAGASVSQATDGV